MKKITSAAKVALAMSVALITGSALTQGLIGTCMGILGGVLWCMAVLTLARTFKV